VIINKKEGNKMKAKYTNLLVMFAGFFASNIALAQEVAHATEKADLGFLGFMTVGSVLGVGLAAFGAASGQGKAASAALEGTARNPAAAGKLFLPLLLSLALMESLVILTWLVTNSLAGSIVKVLGKTYGLTE
jgi:F-type H+-transporting ATPase subunit c